MIFDNEITPWAKAPHMRKPAIYWWTAVHCALTHLAWWNEQCVHRWAWNSTRHCPNTAEEMYWITPQMWITLESLGKFREVAAVWYCLASGLRQPRPIAPFTQHGCISYHHSQSYPCKGLFCYTAHAKQSRGVACKAVCAYSLACSYSPWLCICSMPG